MLADLHGEQRTTLIAGVLLPREPVTLREATALPAALAHTLLFRNNTFDRSNPAIVYRIRMSSSSSIVMFRGPFVATAVCARDEIRVLPLVRII